ncbi:MAG: His/Gly/Thr/Pro-type tRNA ligase C-terminal domain-containing protein, partial [Verrucomicrobia bacterium]|nr:His/Gly/Thr/Pro-type tRNA ligase C-terminal domain-containing protein [Verrucomicrobiota bacterium]
TCDVFVVVAEESRRPEALRLISNLRNAGIRTDFPLTPTKINKQFKAADATLARFAIVVGNEFPELKVKILSSRTETSIAPNADPVDFIQRLLDAPDGPLLT